MSIQHRAIPACLAALLVAAALLACSVLVARANAAPRVDLPGEPSAGQALLSTATFEVRPTSATTAELIGRGTDAGGRVRVELAGGTVGTTPVALWAELSKWLTTHVGSTSGCTTRTEHASFSYRRITVAYTTETDC